MTIAEDVARCIAVSATHSSGVAASASDPTGDAVISECGTYRYFLTRRWRPGNKGVLWCMLNPSTANASVPDATVRKVIGFSSRWGFDYAAITNIRPYRSRHPSELRKWLRTNVGHVRLHHTNLSDDYTREALKYGMRVVTAWGANGIHDEHQATCMRILLVCKALRRVDVGHLGLTNDGHPRHPLTLAYVTPFTPYTSGT